MPRSRLAFIFFFFTETTTTAIYTLSLHDALPIYAHDADLGEVDDRRRHHPAELAQRADREGRAGQLDLHDQLAGRSEEHTSELQSRRDLVCRLLLEKKKKPKQCQHQTN